MTKLEVVKNIKEVFETYNVDEAWSLLDYIDTNCEDMFDGEIVLGYNFKTWYKALNSVAEQYKEYFDFN